MLRLVLAAEQEPISLDDAKLHLRVDGDEEDLLLSGFIASAREVVERQTGYALAIATYEWDTPSAAERLPIEPAVAISQPGVMPVRFRTDPGPAPQALRAAILLLVADLYANREAGITGTIHVVNPTVDRLVFPYRRLTP
ncbi:head-tail connector protein [Stenotrophomonas sp. NPDC078853]|uniref:head-tail connector protein n=1 Tax=Stenotrophomonas sp. NPDC078853 TaxID=3364534 RepID=UPI00384F3DA4